MCAMNYDKMTPDIYKSLAELYRAKCTLFEQKNWIMAFPYKGVDNGVCRALSAAYLLRNFTRALQNFEHSDIQFEGNWITEEQDNYLKYYGPKNFFQSFKPALNARNIFDRQSTSMDEKRFSNITKLQKKHQEKDVTRQLITKKELIDSVINTVADVTNKRLVYENTHECAGNKIQSSFLELPSLMNEQYWMISIGGHAMALVSRSKDFGTKKVWKFFDPNLGQAVFNNHGNIVDDNTVDMYIIKFLQDFFSKTLVPYFDPVFFVRFKPHLN